MSTPKPINVNQHNEDQVGRQFEEDTEAREKEALAEDTFASGSTTDSQRSDATLYGGDVDAAQHQTDAGEETVGGSSPTPDQDVVEELGNAVGITYEDNEPLRFGDKLADRDAQRWELNPASSEDYSARLRNLSGDGESTVEQVPLAKRPTKKSAQARTAGKRASRSPRPARARARKAQKKTR